MATMPKRPADLQDVFGDVFGEVIRSTFDAMEWCEDEIHRLKQLHPGHEALLDQVFGLACPTVPLRGLETLYRAHVRLLGERLLAGGDTREATEAELLGVLMEISLATPLGSASQAAYALCFRACFPDTYPDEVGELLLTSGYRETLIGQGGYNPAEEALLPLRRRLKVPGRKIKTPKQPSLL